jgi:hypothetical protein
MGLDMYLTKKNYVKRWEHNKPEEQFEISVKRGGETYSTIKPERVSYVIEEVMYWRKANQIHGFFVNKGYEITPDVKYQLEGEHIVELLDTCKKVLEILNRSEKKTVQVVGGWRNGEDYMVDVEVYDKADEVLELLPPTEGFFFGSYQIDKWYKQQIEETISVLEEELSVSGDNYPEYEYYASW